VAFKSWFQDWEVSHLGSKVLGIGSSWMASKLAVLTTTSDYAHFWASWSLTAPTIIDKGAFEAKITTTLGMLWLMIDHFGWKFLENQKVTGSPMIQVEKSAPPSSPANLIDAGKRKEDPPPKEAA